MASNGGGAGDDVTRINQLVSIATTGAAGLVVKGIRDGVERGWVLEGGSFRSDRQSEALLSPAALLQLSGPQSPMVYTLVVSSTARRIGIDRDGDSFFDRDERDAGSDPADPTSVPGSCTGDLDGSHVVDGADLGALLANWNGSGFGDIDQSGVVDGVDLGMLLAAWGNCP
jgi:hypothetical protein